MYKTHFTKWELKKYSSRGRRAEGEKATSTNNQIQYYNS